MRSYTTACLGVACKASILPRRNSIRASSIISGQDASLSSEHGHQFPLEYEPDCINSNASHATLCLLFLLGYRFHWRSAQAAKLSCLSGATFWWRHLAHVLNDGRLKIEMSTQGDRMKAWCQDKFVYSEQGEILHHIQAQYIAETLTMTRLGTCCNNQSVLISDQITTKQVNANAH
jgi:hypothetical protein